MRRGRGLWPWEVERGIAVDVVFIEVVCRKITTAFHLYGPLFI